MLNRNIVFGKKRSLNKSIFSFDFWINYISKWTYPSVLNCRDNLDIEITQTKYFNIPVSGTKAGSHICPAVTWSESTNILSRHHKYNWSSHLGIHKQTNASWSLPRSQAVFYHFKMCRKWDVGNLCYGRLLQFYKWSYVLVGGETKLNLENWGQGVLYK